ncbi:type IX secretion system sortase PorU [Spirosoma endbachense]|uniref:Type IX secretion system sortase PorU n=1 Tax=Spirosoma endbachense TaxID=2666025 RepID=A0A6P1W0K2_9BACT|nr:type IX secretion system sortase PorU [Spirosoma endbachense]QHV98118.1 type IX secretion system sortase PorU [Spirosoma endbachense]
MNTDKCMIGCAVKPTYLPWIKAIGLVIIYCSLAVVHSSAQSVLKEGTWIKIGVTESGVYRLDQATLARFNPAFATADPRKLRLYGNGGAVLPQPNATSRAADLTENAIQVIGEADGKFDSGDALLFFGQSPHVIRYDSLARRFSHQINPYSDTTFYFLTIGNAPGLRIAERPAGTLTTTPSVTVFDDYQFHEQDLLKVPAVHSGREWLGEYMTNDTIKNISFDMQGVVAQTPVRLTSSVVAGALSSTQFRLQLNGQTVGTQFVSSISGYEYDYQGITRIDTFFVKPTSVASPVQIALTFQKNGQSFAQGYLNYIGVQTRRELRQYDKPIWIRRLDPGQCAIRQATAGLRIWNIKNPLIPQTQSYTVSTTAEARWAATDRADYFLFTDNQLLTPVSLAVVANQNVKGLSTPNLLIITAAAWRDEAERLATFRREHDQLAVEVVTIQQIYNEFGSGQADPTAIRDAARFFYQKQPNQLRYLLLFGDATFDYRNINQQLSSAQLANTIPVYESYESLHPVLSYSSDDYFGFMDISEGEWPETDKGDYKMDIGVGRLPVKSSDEAKTVVDKLIRYSADPSLVGDWQTRVMFVADDGDYNIHQQDANSLATTVETKDPSYRPERIFLDAYPQESTSNGQKSPIVNQLINRGIADGRLIINYSGHGGAETLADEQVVTLQDILSWKNRRLPLFVTATCQFGRYDDPGSNSGAELALLSRLGGAIALLTTTRPVYANTNLVLNKSFYNAVFAPVNGQMPRLGDVMRLTKNESLVGPVNRNFALLGDPSMRLAYPSAQVMLTKVNGHSVSSSKPDTLHALETVELSGEIQQDGQRLTDFTGTLRLTLYDKSTTQTTLGTESAKMNYKAYTSTLFAGQAIVQNGQFTVRFVMPKDIDYTVGLAKLYTYAVRNDSLFDASGSYDSLRVGGSLIVDSLDTQPPVMHLSVDGGIAEGEQIHVAGPDVTLHVGLRDNQGINTARAGLGHELTIQLNDQSPIILNDVYVAVGNDGKQGEAVYTFRDVTPGTYVVRAKAWDINNNSTEETLSIVVSGKPALGIGVLQASPNPITTQSTITVEHNRPGEPLDWMLQIFDLNGRLFSQQKGQCSDCPSKLEIGTWYGLTDAGQAAPNGLYIFRIHMQSAADGSVVDGSGRLILLK